MQKRRLGQTAIEVSVLGLGTVKFGRNQGVKYPQQFTLPSDQDIKHLLSLCQDWGINLLDTAPAYGSSEERLGMALKHQRQQWVLSTKVGETFFQGQSSFNFSPLSIHNSIHTSLQRLQTDYLDIVLVHSDGRDRELVVAEGVFESLSKLKTEGKIRAFGMSSKTVDGGLLSVANADLAMVTLNPNYTDELPVIEAARQQQKGIMIKKAFGSGHLDPKFCLPFILETQGVSSIIIGTINPEHLRENVHSVQQVLDG